MKQAHRTERLKNNTYAKKPMILLITLLFVCVCTASIYFYVHQLENTFLDNTMFYMSEIADHDMKSVDEEIDNQWKRLDTIGKKLSLEHFKNAVDIQHFLNLESNATGFKELKLIDENGQSYSSNYLVNDITKTDWGAMFMQDKQNFVMRSQARENFVVLYSNLMYGVSMNPVTIDGTTYIGIVGKYTIDSVKDSLQLTFFNGEGQAEVVGRDGIVITTDVTQRGVSLENILDQLKKASIIKHDTYEDINQKLSNGEAFDTLYKVDGETYIMFAKPLKNADWMVVVTVPYSVSSSQTMMFLKMTAILLTILCIVIAIVLIFAFISFKRTMILKNSKEIFYRERLFNLLTNHTDDVFIIQDAEKNTLNFISENAARILGISPKVGEKTDLSLLDDDSKTLLLNKLKEIEKKNIDTNGEHGHTELEFAWIMPTNKEKKWMHMSIYNAIADFAGKPESCLIVVISDYTQIKENQIKLEHAIEQAQDAAKSKTLFLSNMSHEMRTPLNGIIGCIGMMKVHYDDPKQLENYLEKAESTANYLISLVSDILDMSKIESHKMTLDERKISLREIYSNIDTMFRSQMEEKGIQFEIKVKEPLYIILGDEVRIQQILINLLGNALKFTNEGGMVVLDISQEQLDDKNVKTHFTVSDTGIGMSQQFLSRIWTPFEQERLDNARLHGGTGLGLAISYELATLMNGTISVQSKLGEGSQFHVEITHAYVSEDQKAEKQTAHTIEKGQLAGYTILVAEDNELNREILIAMLTETGASIMAAENGKEALDLFKESKEGSIDAILMDMQMPVMDGCSATVQIRALDRSDAASVIIIACTANAFQEDIDRALKAGMNKHIAKPLDMIKLITLLNELREEKQNEKT